MKTFNLCLLGFGNVGRALAALLVAKRENLRERFGIDWRVTGVASRRMGWIAGAEGLDVAKLLSGDAPPADASVSSVEEWLTAARADVLFETTSLEPFTGGAAVSYLRAALEHGAHAVTANKGTVVHAYRELSELAVARSRRFMFEATVADCLPVFSLFRETLPAARLLGFRGVLNSTTNVILAEMERGATFDDGVRAAQALGIAETDPTYDVDGWDATVKACAIANVLMGARLKPADVRREGIRDLDPRAVRDARRAGTPLKLVTTLGRTPEGSVEAVVRPEPLVTPDPLTIVEGTTLMVHFQLDVLPGLSLIAHGPNLQSTAYGMLADFINAAVSSH